MCQTSFTRWLLFLFHDLTDSGVTNEQCSGAPVEIPEGWNGVASIKCPDYGGVVRDIKCHWRLGGEYLYTRQWKERPAYQYLAGNDTFFLYFNHDAWYISSALGSDDVFAYTKSNANDVRGISSQWFEYCDSTWGESDLTVTSFVRDATGFLQCAVPCGFTILNMTVSDHGTGYNHAAPPLVYCDFGEILYRNATIPNKTWGVCTPPQPQYSIVVVEYNGTNLDWADTDGDGGVSEAELSQYFRTFGGTGSFSAIDADRDGGISVPEFDNWFLIESIPDANGDGNVSVDELVEYEMNLYNRSVTNMTTVTRIPGLNGSVLVFAPRPPPLKYRNKTVVTIPPQTCVDEEDLEQYLLARASAANNMTANNTNLTNSSYINGTNTNGTNATNATVSDILSTPPPHSEDSANATGPNLAVIRPGGNLSLGTGLAITPVIPNGLRLEVKQGRTSVLETGAHATCLGTRVPHGRIVIERGQLAGLEKRLLGSAGEK